MSRTILCISMDLDPLWCYRRIHGLGQADERQADPVVPVACARFAELAGNLEVPGTLFVVGSCLDDPRSVAALQETARQGHELSNHTYSHPYDLSRRPEQAIAEEIERGAGSLEEICGQRPRGFRAPGYLLGSNVLPAALRSGISYDSSILPSPAYQGVKAAVLGLLRLRGRQSQALLGDPREALGPTRPYRPDLRNPWRPGSGPLLELPISSVFGLPLTGTLLGMIAPSRVGWLASLAAQLPFVNLELHGIDLMDIAADRLDPALSVQRDLAVPWQRKAAAISAFAERLLISHRPMTLAQAADTLGG